MKKMFLCLLTVFFLSNSGLANSDKTLATVNNEPIFMSDFEKNFNPFFEQYKQSVPKAEQNAAREKELKDMVLNQKIDETVLMQEVKKQKIKVSKKEIQDFVNNQKQQINLTDAAFDAELKKAGTSRVEYEKRIEEMLAVQKLNKQAVEPKIKKPSEADVKKFYDEIMLKVKGKNTGLPPQEDAAIGNIANQIKRVFGEQVKISQIFINAQHL
jgi:peptidyl-prolyl cis-trans isomerase SurA